MSGLVIKPHFKVQTVETDAGCFVLLLLHRHDQLDFWTKCLQWSRGLLISRGDSNPQMNY